MTPLVKLIDGDCFAPRALEAFCKASGSQDAGKQILSELGDFGGMVTYLPFDCKITSESMDFGFFSFRSGFLSRHMTGAEKATLFIATVGTRYDELLNRYSKTSPEKAYCAQMLGMYLVEELCDLFECEDEKNHPGMKRISRFSPGFGDFSLEYQETFFELLRPEKTINVTLNQSLLMSPSKTVSAVIGYRL